MAIKWLKRSFLSKKQVLKGKVTHSSFIPIRDEEKENNLKHNSTAIAGARLAVFCELMQRYVTKLEPRDNPSRPFELIVLGLIMEENDIDWKSENAVVELYYALTAKLVPAAKFEFEESKFDLMKMEILQRVEWLVERHGMSVKGACEHIKNKYPDRFPARLREKYIELKKTEPTLSQLALSIAKTEYKGNPREDLLDEIYFK